MHFKVSANRPMRYWSERDEALPERIQFKSSLRFVNTIVSFVKHAVGSGFSIRKRLRLVPRRSSADEILERYQGLSQYPVFDRLDMLADSVTTSFRINMQALGEKLPPSARGQNPAGRFDPCSSMLIRWRYTGRWLSSSVGWIFSSAQKISGLEYADIFPLVFIHLMTRKVDAYKQTKHLIIDEMQDYSPVQYATNSPPVSLQDDHPWGT